MMMQKFSRKDLEFSLVTGLITGVIAWQVLDSLVVPTLYGLPWAALVIIVPMLWIVGVNIGYFLGQWFAFFNQFGRFVAIGFTNTAVNFAVLNTLIAYGGWTSGFGYAVIATISFAVAMFSSYFWNKFWAFNAARSNGGGREFWLFTLVTIVSFIINVGVASLVVNLVHPWGGLNAHQWANVGDVAGTAVALIFSFVGFKIAVFKK